MMLPDREKRIVIVNAPWNNHGDEAALRQLIKAIYNINENCVVTVLLKNQGEIIGFPVQENIKVHNAKFKITLREFRKYLQSQDSINDKAISITIDCIRKADLVVYAPGGSVINDRFFWWKQLEYLFPIALAKKFCVPFLMSAPSIGPFKRGHVIRNILLRYAHICVREPISKKYLLEAGISANVKQTLDLAFASDYDVKEGKSKLQSPDCSELLTYLESHSRCVGITITDFKWHIVYGKNDRLRERIKNTFDDLITYLKEKKYGVVLIPQLFGNENDEILLREFATDDVFVMPAGLDCSIQQCVISRLFSLIGMRYHSSIFAAKVGTPFVPIVYEEKMRGFIQDNPFLASYAVELDELEHKKVIWVFENLLETYSDYKKTLELYHDKWKRKAGITFEFLPKFLGE